MSHFTSIEEIFADNDKKRAANPEKYDNAKLKPKVSLAATPKAKKKKAKTK